MKPSIAKVLLKLWIITLVKLQEVLVFMITIRKITAFLLGILSMLPNTGVQVLILL
ncbi:hypothetical protein D3C80_2017620 [compost metagenome]